MARTVADAFNQYHQNYVQPQVESKLSTSAAAATYATQASLAVKADLDSPNFTGTPTAPTPGNDTDSTQIATTEFVQNLIRRLVGSAPETLNTLVELATAINNDPNFAETIVQALDGKLNKTDAANTYLTKTANAASASRDENGNVIHTTYATKSELGNVSVAQATSSTAGVMKLYTGTGTATDGTMTQNAIVTQLSMKASSTNPTITNPKITNPTISDLTISNSSVQVSSNNLELTVGGHPLIDCLRTISPHGVALYGIQKNNLFIWLQDSDNSCRITASGGLYVNGTKVGS